jgi:UDPglucose 6-dehydrogenase
VKVVAFDPIAMTKAAELPVMKNVELGADPYDAARGAHAVAIITEWNEFRGMNLSRLKRVMKSPVLCDLRNIYDRAEVEAAGFRHVGVGKGRAGVPAGAKRARARKRK